MGRPRARLTFTRFASPRPSILAFEPRLRPLTPSFTQTCARPQLLRGLKYVHTANVYHRDLKPKNILANADCKLKICDFGLARPAFHDSGPTTVFWTDYVATRWYRAPELCGSFFTKYTPAIDIWSIGCIFAEILSGRPLFPGKNVVHQLEIITDLLGTPHPDVINRVRNEKARRFLGNMRVKPRIPFASRFPGAAPAALALLERMLAFDPEERPTAEEALADPYFAGLSDPSREPAAEIVSRTEYAFESKKLSPEEVRDLLYKEILEYHPQAKREFEGGERPSRFSYAKSAVGQDFAAADLVVVLGTSLCVQPFASLVNEVGPLVPRLLINRELRGPFAKLEATTIPPHQGDCKTPPPPPPLAETGAYRDAAFVGDCDEGVTELCALLGFTTEFEELLEVTT